MARLRVACLCSLNQASMSVIGAPSISTHCLRGASFAFPPAPVFYTERRRRGSLGVCIARDLFVSRTSCGLRLLQIGIGQRRRLGQGPGFRQFIQQRQPFARGLWPKVLVNVQRAVNGHKDVVATIPVCRSKWYIGILSARFDSSQAFLAIGRRFTSYEVIKGRGQRIKVTGKIVRCLTVRRIRSANSRP